MRPSAIHHGRNIVRRLCHDGCGSEVDSFRDEIGLIRQLEIGPVPANLDIARDEFRGRLWVYHGRNLGWYLANFPRRSTREIRLEHECVNTPERKRKSKPRHKDEEENKYD